ncbi:MAG: glycosyltransferase [Chthoniobacterales bacterium]|nr:glycosyltransferase [Chthoniobacterales bacterium]
MPTVSLITPSLNQGQFLGECLDSVQAAAATAGVSVEHLVVDGGSTDQTRELLASQSLARWISEPDNGQTDAINKGLRQTSGQIVSYLCADDLLEPAALAEVLEAWKAEPSADVVYGDAYFLESGWKRRKIVGPFSGHRLRKGNFLIQPAVFLQRRVFEKFGLLDASLKFCMDHEFWLRISGETHWKYVQAPLACSRLHADAKTWSQLPTAWEEARIMQKKYGIHWRPLRDALWMRTVGWHYYRMKRILFARIAKGRHS